MEENPPCEDAEADQDECGLEEGEEAAPSSTLEPMGLGTLLAAAQSADSSDSGSVEDADLSEDEWAVYDLVNELLDFAPKNTRRLFALAAFYGMRSVGAQRAEAVAIAKLCTGVPERTIRDWRDKAELRREIAWDQRLGKKVRHRSLLDLIPDERDKLEAKIEDFVRSTTGQKGRANSTLAQITAHINNHVLREYIDHKTPGVHRISQATAARWLKNLGFNYTRTHKRTGFTDGHERDDNVDARAEYIRKIGALRDQNKERTEKLARIHECEALIAAGVATAATSAGTKRGADGGNLSSGEEVRKIRAERDELDASLPARNVIIHTDEAVFHSNDDRQGGWFRPGDINVRLPCKSEGAGIMALVFMTEDGLVKLQTPEQIQRAKDEFQLGDDFDGTSSFLLKIGKNRDGYMDSKKYLSVVQRMLQIFKIQYPNDKPVLVVDQSGVHLRWGDNALRASKILLNDDSPDKHAVRRAKAKERNTQQPLLKGWYKEPDGTVRVQKFYYESNDLELHGRRKGGATILRERGKSPPDGRKWTVATMRAALEAEPDFCEETCDLEKLVHSMGGELIISPKYHCEFNACELGWAACKKFTREHCNYTISDLEKMVRVSFELLTPKLCRHMFDHTEAWRLAYLDGATNGTEAKECVRLRRKERRDVRKKAEDEAQLEKNVQELREMWDEMNSIPSSTGVSQEARQEEDTAEGSFVERIAYRPSTSHRQVPLPCDMELDAALAERLKQQMATFVTLEEPPKA